MSSFLLELSGLQAPANATLDAYVEDGHKQPELGWSNVAIASGFILVNGSFFERLKNVPHVIKKIYIRLGIMSVLLGLKLEKSLIIASIRCLVQLTIMVKEA